jgi:hypothetical protein
VISAGGVGTVVAGGTASASTIAGGTLGIVSGGLGAAVTFTDSGGDLAISSLVMPTATISGFAAGDDVTLTALTYSSTYTTKVATAGVVTISASGHSYSLNISGAAVGETNFTLSSATGGGTELGLSGALGAAVRMNFVRPVHAQVTMAPREDFAPTAPVAFHRGTIQDAAPHTASAHFAGAVPDLFVAPRGAAEAFAPLRAGHWPFAL